MPEGSSAQHGHRQTMAYIEPTCDLDKPIAKVRGVFQQSAVLESA